MRTLTQATGGRQPVAPVIRVGPLPARSVAHHRPCLARSPHNGGLYRYRACRADRAAWNRARRPKPAKLVTHPVLRELVEGKLALRWSPQQIAGWLSRAYPDDPELRVSQETIYMSLFVQSRGALRRQLTRYLRTRRMVRRPQLDRASPGKVNSAMRSTSARAPLKSLAGPYPDTGKVISGSAGRTARSRRWWNAPVALPCSSR
jgi:hypothetical protein